MTTIKWDGIGAVNQTNKNITSQFTADSSKPTKIVMPRYNAFKSRADQNIK